MCNAAITATYTIKCTVTLSNGKRKTLQTQLRVSAGFNGEPGQTAGPSVTGYPPYLFNSSTGLWEVTGTGTMTGTAPAVTINIPNTSQFYSKAVAHKNQHVAN